MASAVIGALRVNLGIDTAQFSEGLKGIRASLDKAGRSMQQVGAKLSTYVSAPITAAGAVVTAAVNSMAKDLVDLERAAQISNVDFEQFQKLAFAARSVGIESDKLGDIFKDVNDRVGDFVQTGGGPMADFFEKIAPQVGITADAFKDLSGPQALQLYYDSLVKAGVSQQDMTFYLEAMASDVTALIPLLQDGGKGFRELGEGASVLSAEDADVLRAYNDAMRALGEAVKGATMAIANSGLLEMVTQAVQKITEWIKVLSETNPQLLKWGSIVAGLAAALGPVVVALGLFLTAVAAISAPVLAVVAAVAALTAGLIAFWPEIEHAATATQQFFIQLGEEARAKIDAFITKVVEMKDMALQAVQAMVTGVTEWVTGKLNAVWDAVTSKVDKVKQSFFNLYDAVVGHSYVPDMVTEIGQWMELLDQNMVRPAQQAVDGVSASMESLGDTGQTLGSAIGNAFKGVIDGSKSVKQAISEVLRELASMLANEAFRMLFGGAASGGGFFGGLFSALGFRANGGPVRANRPYIVGERGPELMVPDTSGTVIKNSDLQMGGGAVDVRVAVDNNGNLQAFVERTSGRVSAKVIQAAAPGIVQASVQATQTTSRDRPGFFR